MVDATGAYAKLSRADALRKELGDGFREYFSGEVVSLRHVHNTDPADGQPRYELLATLSRPVPPNLALIAGDVLHNVRSSLDHLAWVLTAKQTDRTQFPAIKGPDLSRARWLKAVREFAPRSGSVRKRLESMKPTPAATDEWLFVLHSLDILDKHKLLLVLAGASTAVAYNPFEDLFRPSALDDFRGKLPFIEIRPAEIPVLDRPDVLIFGAQSEADLTRHHHKIELVFGEPAMLRGRSVEATLSELTTKCRALVDELVALDSGGTPIHTA